MRARPLHDRIVIRRFEREGNAVGGSTATGAAKAKSMEGEVVAVGPGKRNERGVLVPPSVELGDRIAFSKWSGTNVKIDGAELLIVAAADVMCVITTNRAK